MPEFKKDTDGFMKKTSGFKMKGFSGFHGSSPMQKKSKTTSTSVQAEMDAKAVEMGSPLHVGVNLGISADTKTKGEVRAAQDHAAGVVEREEKRADRKERKAEKAASKGKDRKAKRKQRKADKIREALAPLKRRKSEIGNSDSAYKKLAYKKSWGGLGKTKIVEIDDSPNKKLDPMYNGKPGVQKDDFEQFKKKSPKKKYGSAMDKHAAPYKKNGDKKVPSIPKKNEAPATTVARLQKKKQNGTITQAELKKLQKLQTMMETGPGSYGNEQWDKE
jgi:hypothetical protein